MKTNNPNRYITATLVAIYLCCFVLSGCSSSAKIASIHSSSASDLQQTATAASSQHTSQLSQLNAEAQSDTQIEYTFIEYDTALPADTATRRPPVKRVGHVTLTNQSATHQQQADSLTQSLTQSSASDLRQQDNLDDQTDVQVRRIHYPLWQNIIFGILIICQIIAICQILWKIKRTNYN